MIYKSKERFSKSSEQNSNCEHILENRVHDL